MKALLEKIRLINEKTGLRILDNPYDYGSCDVVDKNNKSQFRGDRISCQVFINKSYEKINEQPCEKHTETS